jgi:hypothetical protein
MIPPTQGPKNNTGFIGSISDGWKIMHDTGHDVMVDLIMVQVISLFIGAFLLLAANGNEMGGNQITWVVGMVMIFFILAGSVYRRLSR